MQAWPMVMTIGHSKASLSTPSLFASGKGTIKRGYLFSFEVS